MKETSNGTLVLTDRWADYRWLDSVLADYTRTTLWRDEDACVGIDVETRTTRKNAKAPNVRADLLHGVGLALTGDSHSLPIYGLATDGLLSVLKARLPVLPWMAFNAMFDATVVRRYGVKLGKHVGDARIIAYLLGEPDASLKPLLLRWMNYPTVEYHELLEEYDVDSIAGVPLEVQADYCALQDAAQCVALERLMRKEMDERSLGVYTNIELPMVQILIEMSERGIRLDRELTQPRYEADVRSVDNLDRLIRMLVKQTGFFQWEERDGKIWLPTCKSCHNGKKKKIGCQECGGAGKRGPVIKEFNPGSDDQLRAWLYDWMKALCRRWTDSGEPSCDALALLQLKEFHEAVPIILSRRKRQKKASFRKKWLELSEADGRIHTTFTNTTVVSGRLSSKDPNLTQVTQVMRDEFTADEG